MNKKILIAVVALIIVSICFAACNKSTGEEPTTITQVVTDAQGEPVTNDDGEVVTEVVAVVTDAQGNTITQPIGSSRPSKPDAVTNLKATDIKMDSLTLSWSGVSCDGYQISYSEDGGFNWSYLDKAYTKTSYSVSDLISYTDYQFRVRSYNQNSAGITEGDWVYVDASTEPNEDFVRQITIDIVLPNIPGTNDTVTIYVDGEIDGTDTVALDGSTYTYTTENEYKGLVSVKVVFTKTGYDKEIKTDKENCSADFSQEGISYDVGEDD